LGEILPEDDRWPEFLKLFGSMVVVVLIIGAILSFRNKNRVAKEKKAEEASAEAARKQKFLEEARQILNGKRIAVLLWHKDGSKGSRESEIIRLLRRFGLQAVQLQKSTESDIRHGNIIPPHNLFKAEYIIRGIELEYVGDYAVNQVDLRILDPATNEIIQACVPESPSHQPDWVLHDKIVQQVVETLFKHLQPKALGTS
jgi:hypothetical protein